MSVAALVDDFQSDFRDKRLFFFAGSGVSYASNLPSAEKILEITSQAVIPDISDFQLRVCKSIQPELFYEALIRVCGDRRCLGVWKSLHLGTQAQFGCEAVPNDCHHTIVDYSFRARQPIITTNFDTMFERAADDLGIKYEVFGPKDSPPTSFDSLAICKIHGSVEGNGGQFSVESLWATATEISTFNFPWINFFHKLMESSSICFVGYSGRDIDIFPHIRRKIIETPDNVRRAYWVGKFSDTDPATARARDCTACMIDGFWPSELFARIGVTRTPSHCQGDADNAEEERKRREEKFEEMFTALRKDLAREAFLESLGRKIFLSIIASHGVDYRESERIVTGVDVEDVRDASKRMRALYFFQMARSAHERSHYLSLGHYGWRALWNSMGCRDDAIHALTILSESMRMRIPADGYFPLPPLLKLLVAFFSIITALHFMIVLCFLRLLLVGRRLGDLSPEARHSVIEHQIRCLALAQRMLGAMSASQHRVVNRLLRGAWRRIFDTSHSHGYAAGMANAYKFLYRIARDADHGPAGEIYKLFSYRTGEELMRRNEADRALQAGDFQEALQKFDQFRSMAALSGNRLNEIKAYQGMFRARQCLGNARLASEEERRVYSALTRNFEGVLWRWFFRSVDRRLPSG